ncbi:Late embryogenesis abundant protein [Sesbania bispinosa]|nr:Late embryogenesis abundant protein [Sesbania bispinosa]
MSQEQPQRPQEEKCIKYGDVFNVQDDLGFKTVMPVNAKIMQKAENAVVGKTQKGGARRCHVIGDNEKRETWSCEA